MTIYADGKPEKTNLSQVRAAGNHIVVALCGPQGAGKTSLMRQLYRMAEPVQGRRDGLPQVGDRSTETDILSMGTAMNLVQVTVAGQSFIFVDCPGSVEFIIEAKNGLQAVDVAVVVAEAQEDKLYGLTPILHDLEASHIPHLLFINKIDKNRTSIRDFCEQLKDISLLPPVLREVPLRKNDTIVGYVDLAAKLVVDYDDEDTATPYDEVKDGLDADVRDRIEQDSYAMLETLADFHEHLLEEIIEDIEPPSEEVLEDLALDINDNHIMPVFFGSATDGAGVMRMIRSIQQDIPAGAALDHQLFLTDTEQAQLKPMQPVFYVLKTMNEKHTGMTAIARIVSGHMEEGSIISSNKMSSLSKPYKDKRRSATVAQVGDIVFLPKLSGMRAGSLYGVKRQLAEHPDSVYARAVTVEHHQDDARLSGALSKLCEENASYQLAYNQDVGEVVIWGQGEIHLKAAQIRLQEFYHIVTEFDPPHVAYKETIKGHKLQHSRYKKQSGGHGQFGDVVIDIQPGQAGEGFMFTSEITGGAIPRQYIPSVEAGIRDRLKEGPLGFPVVDVRVTLKDGSYHSVDSSDMAFKAAAKMAAGAALPDCDPVLLEPVEKVTVMAPSVYAAKLNGLVSARRGQILGFDIRPGWPGWDQLEALMPQSEIMDLIIELRSVTQGTGTFTHEFHHLAEYYGSKKESNYNIGK